VTADKDAFQPDDCDVGSLIWQDRQISFWTVPRVPQEEHGTMLQLWKTQVMHRAWCHEADTRVTRAFRLPFYPIRIRSRAASNSAFLNRTARPILK
jgi:hypothetical protein